MVASSILYPGEHFITEDNFEDHVHDPVIDGTQMSRGLIPRDWEKEIGRAHV